MCAFGLQAVTGGSLSRIGVRGSDGLWIGDVKPTVPLAVTVILPIKKKKKTHRACPVSIPTFNLSCKEKILLFCCSVLSYTCPLSQVLELQPPNYSLTYHLLSI